MKVRWVFLTMAAALVLGFGAGFAFTHPVRATAQVLLSCFLLNQAEKAGYLDEQKRSLLLDRVAEAKSLDASVQQSVRKLKEGVCSAPGLS